MPSDALTHAQQMLDLYRQIESENAGVQSVTVNGTATTMVDIMALRKSYEAEVARLSGANPRVKRMKMGGFR